MSGEAISFFTIDHGTASRSAALVARLGGRFRLLAAGSTPAELPVEPLLEGLVRDVLAVEPSVLPHSDAWDDWARVESGTVSPGRIACVAGSERRLQALEIAVANSGWEIAGRITPERTDALAATELCLPRDVAAVVVGAGDQVTSDERDGLRGLVPAVAAVVRRRRELACMLAGGGDDVAAAFPADQVVTAPSPVSSVPSAPSALRQRLEELAVRRHASPGGHALPDGRAGFRTAILSLAALLERRIEGVDVGHSGGSRVLAGAEELRGSLTRADGALVPAQALHDDRFVDGILRWSPLRGEPLTLRDRVRNLRLAPWRGATGDGARLRLAAARAALSRLDTAWTQASDDEGGRAAMTADLLVGSGGAFAVAPPPAVALALLDTLRRPGAVALLHDHARVLGPLGSLESESDRRRLLADLLDDAFVPLGSAIMAAGLRAGRQAGTLRVTGDRGTTELELMPGTVQLVDLPPGLGATAEVETREGAWLGVKARHVALAVAGGLGGLVVDTRDIPLQLPDRPDRRRELLEAWQRPLWIGGDP